MEKNLGLLPFEKAEKKILIKKQAETSDKFGKRPEQRTVLELLDSGIINIDKPSGPTSHQVSAYLKQILETSKTGHSGTLDPKVTGVLPIAIGMGTRVVDSLLSAGKEYVALMHIHENVPDQKIVEACNSFVGRIKQLPPVKSAVKRQERWRKIYYLSILDIKGQDVLFKVGCQAGTYIRKLIHDIGKKLGAGAHMTELRRTKAGPFNENSLSTLYDVKDAMVFLKKGDDSHFKKIIMPIEKGVEHLPKIWVFDTTVNSIAHGANLKVPGISKLETFDVNETVAVMTLKDELIATGATRMSSRQVMKENKGVVLKLSQVFMRPGVYPKMEK